MTRVGVCSWSLQPASAAELADMVRAAGLDAVQLALDPLRDGRWPEPDAVATLARAGITIRSGMIAFPAEDYSTLDSIRATGGVRPDADWPGNLDRAHANADLARRLGLTLVTAHAGFIPHDHADPLRRVMLDRLRQLADAFSTRGVRLALETGQESADTLLAALADLHRPAVGINFDPANMILYGMGDPIDALRRFLDSGRVAQVHLKDALPAATPGVWGTETPLGRGAVDWPRFFRILHQHRFTGDLMIERESGGSRLDDIRAAATLARERPRDT